VIVLEFTAEWCLNCKALEEGVLRDPRVVERLNGPDVAAIKIDLTGRNEPGNAKLIAMQRRSIPLLVIFDRSGREVFKEDFYTVEQVVQAIEAAGPPRATARAHQGRLSAGRGYFTMLISGAIREESELFGPWVFAKRARLVRRTDVSARQVQLLFQMDARPDYSFPARVQILFTEDQGGWRIPRKYVFD
jgi:hypothetical protein